MARQRRTMIRKVLASTKLDGELRRRLEALLSEADTIADQRNRYIHDQWTPTPDNAWMLSRETIPGQSYDPEYFPRIVDNKELKHLVDRAEALVADCVGVFLLFREWRLGLGFAGGPEVRKQMKRGDRT